MWNIATPRQRGKTTWAIKLAAKEDATLVVANHSMIESHMEKAEKLGLTIKKPITHHEFINGQKLAGLPKSSYIIDDAELLLQSLCKYPHQVIASTMTGSGLPSTSDTVDYEKPKCPVNIEPSDLKRGDRVVCIDNAEVTLSLIEGREYIVDSAIGDIVCLQTSRDATGAYHRNRFRLIPSETD